MTTPAVDTARLRVREYIAIRAKARGLDPEAIHTYNEAVLYMSDLRALCDAADRAMRLEAALREVLDSGDALNDGADMGCFNRYGEALESARAALQPADEGTKP